MNDIILQTERVSKSFGSLTAVDELSIDVREGEIFGLLGPNGAGKTTSIHIICGLLKPDAGRVLLRGREITGDSAEARARVGICPQVEILWDKLTCLEQLEFVGEMYDLPRNTARQRGMELLEALGLAEKRGALAGTLSGGMKRRLNLALGLVHDPEIIILDEPEAGLDPQSRILVRDYIRSLSGKKTILLTTHNMDEADRLADRVAIIDHGRLLVVDTPEVLKQRVGRGDVLEIQLSNGLRDEERARLALAGTASEVRLAEGGSLLRVRALNAVGRLAAILQSLEAAGFCPGEVNIHANSLEDVFIQLTGRSLRE